MEERKFFANTHDFIIPDIQYYAEQEYRGELIFREGN